MHRFTTLNRELTRLFKISCTAFQNLYSYGCIFLLQNISENKTRRHSMNPIDRNKIWKMVGILALITVGRRTAKSIPTQFLHSGDYATDNPSLAYQTSEPSPTPELYTGRRQFQCKCDRKLAGRIFHGGNYCFDRIFPERRAIDRPADHAVRRLLL